MFNINQFLFRISGMKMINTAKIISGKKIGLLLQQKQQYLCLPVNICGKNQLFIF